MDRAVFYDAVRPHVNLTTQNVEGMERLLDYAEGQARMTNIQWLAYIIATAWWESGQTMHPVKEAYWKSEEWRKANLRYYPWYGRGLVQTTWEQNYRAIAVAMGLPESFFIKNPDLLLTFEYALPALFVGMLQGIYTSKDVGDYIDDIDEDDAEDLREYKNARRVVNSTDKADTIGKLALVFEKGLKASGYVGTKDAPPVPVQKPQPEVPVSTGPSVPGEPQPQKSKGSFYVFVVLAITAAMFVAAKQLEIF